MDTTSASSGSDGAAESWNWSEDYVTVGALKLHYWDVRRLGDSSNGEKRTLLALHGMSSHGDAWRQIIARLSSFDRIICPDFRGHGLSDWTRDGYWLSDYAGDTIGIVDELGVQKFDLVGHSLGARVAMVLGNQLHGRLTSVVLSDTGPEVSRDGALKALAIAGETSQTNGFRDEAALLAFLEKANSGYVPEAIQTRATKLYRKNWAGRYVHRGDSEVTWLLGSAGLKEVDDMWNGLKALTVPVLLVHCTQSFLLDSELVSRMVEATPDLTVATLDSDHMVIYKEPDLFSQALEEFVSAV
jgi:pimeloyl-ACP methyl ester carboxylesterase